MRRGAIGQQISQNNVMFTAVHLFIRRAVLRGDLATLVTAALLVFLGSVCDPQTIVLTVSIPNEHAKGAAKPRFGVPIIRVRLSPLDSSNNRHDAGFDGGGKPLPRGDDQLQIMGRFAPNPASKPARPFSLGIVSS